MNRYKVTIINGEMVVQEDENGKYRATNGEEIRRALTELHYQTTTAEVLIGTGKTWYPLRRTIRHSIKRQRHHLINSEPIKLKPTPMPIYRKILKRVGLYKDPLEQLIYNPKRDGYIPGLSGE